MKMGNAYVPDCRMYFGSGGRSWYGIFRKYETLQPKIPLGKYGRMRRNYLKQHHPVLYNSMLLNGTLYPHLMELEQTAESRMQQMMTELLKQNPAPDKEKNQMSWVRHMNSLRAQTEEIILTELIYS